MPKRSAQSKSAKAVSFRLPLDVIETIRKARKETKIPQTAFVAMAIRAFAQSQKFKDMVAATKNLFGT